MTDAKSNGWMQLNHSRFAEPLDIMMLFIAKQDTNFSKTITVEEWRMIWLNQMAHVTMGLGTEASVRMPRSTCTEILHKCSTLFVKYCYKHFSYWAQVGA